MQPHIYEPGVLHHLGEHGAGEFVAHDRGQGQDTRPGLNLQGRPSRFKVHPFPGHSHRRFDPGTAHQQNQFKLAGFEREQGKGTCHLDTGVRPP